MDHHPRWYELKELHHCLPIWFLFQVQLFHMNVTAPDEFIPYPEVNMTTKS